jgi:hypothetical protein
MQKRKAQATYEFIIAAVLLFSIILYSINVMMTNFTTYREDFYSTNLKNKVSMISEVLVHNNDSGIVTETPGWPVMASAKITALDNECQNSYWEMLNRFELPEHNLRINITESDGTSLLECGRTVPRGIVTAHVERIGVLDTTDNLVRISVYAW